jgi:hypothetical protein
MGEAAMRFTGALNARGTSTRRNTAGCPSSDAVTGGASSGVVVGDARTTVVIAGSAAARTVVAVVVVVVSLSGRALGSEPQAASRTTPTAAAHRLRR